VCVRNEKKVVTHFPNLTHTYNPYPASYRALYRASGSE